MNRALIRTLVIIEALLCFGIPIYTLLWGLLMLPLYMGGVALDKSATVNVLAILGGLSGAWALARALIFCLSGENARRPNLILLTVLGSIGWLALVTVVSGQFTPQALDVTTILILLPPTACALHLAIWTFRKARKTQ